MEQQEAVKLGVNQESLEQLQQGLQTLMRQRAEIEQQIQAQRGAIMLMENLLQASPNGHAEVVDMPEDVEVEDV